MDREQITVVFDRMPPFAQQMELKLTMGAEYTGSRPAGSRDPYALTDDLGRPFNIVTPNLASPYCRTVSRQAKWDNRYVRLAQEVATWSKDPSTKVGAVLVRPNNSVASTGFNGFPPGHDDSPALYADRAYKYQHVVHAEINALEFLTGETPSGFTLYTSFPCCPNCMEAAVKAGVTAVVFPPIQFAGKDEAWVKQWNELIDRSLEIARTNGIQVRWVDV